MEEKIDIIRKVTEKQLRQLQQWRKVCQALAEAYRSDEPDPALLRAHLDRLEGRPEAFPEERADWATLEDDVRHRYQHMLRRYEGQLREACEEAGYTVSGRFPRFTVDGLIEVQVDQEKNRARINRSCSRPL